MKRSVLSPAELEERRTLILALLEEQPYTIGNLSALMLVHRGAVAATLKTLAREQQVHRGADDRWRLGTRPAAAAAPLEDLEDEAEGSDPDADVDDMPTEPAPVLRQHVPTRATVDATPSWWTQAPREGFSRRATIEHKRMRGSKESHQVPLRLLQ